MPLDSGVVGSLRRLGLNEYEARAYYALSTGGKSTAGELSERAELPRPRVYDVLESLLVKGFVAVRPGRPVTYSHLPLNEAVRTLKKQRMNTLVSEFTQMEDVAKILETKIASSTPTRASPVEDAAWTFRGREAAYSKLASMIESARRHVVIASTPSGVLRKATEHGKLLEKAKARGVKVVVVSPIEKDKVANAAVAKLASKMRFNSLPTRFVLADDQAFVFLTREEAPAEDEIGVWVNSPHFTETLRKVAGE